MALGSGRQAPTSGDEVVPDQLALVGKALWLDRLAAIAVKHLASAGVPSILLKGAAVATWLYGDGAVRPYNDIDLLVSPADFGPAKRILAQLGYVDYLAGAAACEWSNEQSLLGPNGICIDLHDRLIGVPDSARCWEVLSRRTVPFTSRSGLEVPILDVQARAMHLALHAAQNGPAGKKPILDLSRGVEQVALSDWEGAARIAEELGATPAFAAGLRLVPAGAALADQLSLPRSMTVELAILSTSADEKALVLQRIADAPGIKAKAALVGRKLFPTAAFLRAYYPAARGGRLALLQARLMYSLTLPSKAARGFWVWRRARREVASAARPWRILLV